MSTYICMQSVLKSLKDLYLEIEGVYANIEKQKDTFSVSSPSCGMWSSLRCYHQVVPCNRAAPSLRWPSCRAASRRSLLTTPLAARELLSRRAPPQLLMHEPPSIYLHPDVYVCTWLVKAQLQVLASSARIDQAVWQHEASFLRKSIVCMSSPAC